MPDEAHEHIHVGAPVERCVGIATDFERYPTWAKDVKAARVLDRDDTGRGRRVEYRVAALGMSVRNVLDYAYDDAGSGFSWHLVEGDSKRYARVKVLETVSEAMEKGAAARGFPLPDDVSRL